MNYFKPGQLVSNFLLWAAVIVSLTGCVGLPDGVKPVQPFDLQRYLGTWYEIARLDHRFERELNQVTATYSRQSDGSVEVKNRGYSTTKKAFKEANGRAVFVGPVDEAHLKVSFFGPFYASYVVFELGSDYDYAFVSGNSRKYLWLLSRKPGITPEVREKFERRATELGFDLTELIWVKH